MAPSGLIAPALYRHEGRKAADLAYARPGFQLHDDAEILAIFAIRDYALETGELDRAIKYLYQTYDLHPGHPMLVAGKNGFVIASLAMLLKKKGDTAAAQTLTNEMREACRNPGNSPLCTAAQALAGEREAALDSLRKSVLQDPHSPYWWYIADHALLWADYHSDPRFQAIAKTLRDGAARQRALLEQMRAKGEVPVRLAAVMPGTRSP
jgi:tetratricopeptide (TPR) repeat protein